MAMGGQFRPSRAQMKQPRYAPPELRLQVLQRDGYRCRYCGTKVTNGSANIDHVVPWKHHGQTVLENLVTACAPCNRLKKNRGHIEPLPQGRSPHNLPDTKKHRRVGCQKPGCTMRHHDLIPPGQDRPDLKRVFNPGYIVVPERQTPCNHRGSPNCLRQRCLEARGIAYEIRPTYP